MTLLSAAVLLFFVMDPLGNVPLFLSALRQVDPARYRIVIVRELLIALVILVVFLFAGRYLLDLLHVSPAALTAGGGLILLLIAVRMVSLPPSDRCGKRSRASRWSCRWRCPTPPAPRCWRPSCCS